MTKKTWWYFLSNRSKIKQKNIGITNIQQKLHILCKVNSSDAAVPFWGTHTKTAHSRSTPEDGMGLPSGKGIQNGHMCSTVPKKLVHYLHQKRNAEEESAACRLFKVFVTLWPSCGQKGREAGKARGHRAGETQPEKNLSAHTLWVSHSIFAIINTSLKPTTSKYNPLFW